MCGVLGIYSFEQASPLIYDSLIMLQHRGQDAAGIATMNDKKFYHQKNKGLITENFKAENLKELQGNIGIAHVRYPTAGNNSNDESQPFYVNHPYGIMLAHNGNITNTQELKNDLIQQELRHLNTSSDSEVLLNIFAHELSLARDKWFLDNITVFSAVAKLMQRIEGGYSVVSMINDFGLVFFRDSYGIRPLIIGKKETSKGTSYLVASESVALDVLGYDIYADIAPGQVGIINTNGKLELKQVMPIVNYCPCAFEFVYFARPDSIIDKISVNSARINMGRMLANKILREWGRKHDIDVVIAIPDTSRTAAAELAELLKLPYREGFIKNRYIARTFIMPGQSERRNSIARKLNPIATEFKDKNVLLVDDSIVRGNTSKKIIELTRKSGAKKVFFASASPPVMYPYVYGIDMPCVSELVAHNRTLKEIEKYLGVDRLIYQDLDDLIKAITSENKKIKQVEVSCFNGEYITKNINKSYLDSLSKRIV